MKKLLTILMLALAACVSERQLEGPAAGQESEITMQAVVPAAAEVQTRAVGSTKENWIDHINVLVFKTTGELVYNGVGRGIVRSGTNMKTVTFKAVLPIGTQYDYVVLANSVSLLNSLKLGTTTKAQVQALVQGFTTDNTEGTNKWDPTAAIPMWGEQRHTLNTTSTPSFTLMRMLARVNVEYTSATPNFKLEKVRYYNYNTKGMLIPSSHTVTAPTLPADPGKQLYQSVEYSSADGTTCKEQIYAFEAAHCGTYAAGGDTWAANPCLVVGGSFDANGDKQFTEKTTWYRIDFIRKTDSAWLSLLRNFSYGVVITSVNGAGYDDPDIALKSAPINITAGVIDWDDGDVDEVIFDGTAYLAVNKHELTFQRNATNVKLADGSNSLAIKTDYTVNGFPERSGWTAKYYTDEDCKNEMATPWLKLHNGALIDKGPVTGNPDQPAADTWFEFTENTGTVNREAWVMIIAGRMRYRVHIVQKLMSIRLNEYITSNVSVPCDSMLFIVPHDNTQRVHGERIFRVTWRPTDKPVKVELISPLQFNPFEPAWVEDYMSGNPVAVTHDTPGKLAANTDPRFFLVQPPTVSDTELARDPFYDKESTYKFTIENNGERDSVGITLRQVFFNIVVDVQKYRLDGSTSTLTVRSNTEWRIKTIEEHLYNDSSTPAPTPGNPVMLQLKQYDNLREGTTGGPNVNGNALAFTTVNAKSGGVQKGKWGTVWVTFESPTDKFPDKTVPLVFPPDTRLILGLGYAPDVTSNNVAFGTPYHMNSAFQMLNSPYNFGSMEQSKVKVEGLRIKGYNTMSTSLPDVPTVNPDFHWHKNSLVSWLNGDNPDVITVSSFQDALDTQFNENEFRLLKEYLEHGGVLIMMYNATANGQANVAKFMEAIFGKVGSGSGGTMTSGYDGIIADTDVRNWGTSPATGGVYKLANIQDPILNGPFGNINGLYWGSHYYRAGIKTSLIANDAITLSTAKELSTGGSGNDDYSIIFRHKTLNLLFIGNSAFTASYYDYYYSQDDHSDVVPFRLDKDNYFHPMGRTNFNPVMHCEVHNSTLLGNAIAWALSVTNHQPPTGGYKNK